MSRFVRNPLGELPEHAYPRDELQAPSRAPKYSEQIEMAEVVRRANFLSIPFGVDTTGQEVISGNKNRAYLLIQNHGSALLFVNFDNPAGPNFIQIAVGGNYEPFVVPTNAIYISSASGIQNGILVEGSQRIR